MLGGTLAPQDLKNPKIVHCRTYFFDMHKSQVFQLLRFIPVNNYEVSFEETFLVVLMIFGGLVGPNAKIMTSGVP